MNVAVENKVQKLCMHICKYLYIYIYIHNRTYTCVYMSIQIHTCMYTRVFRGHVNSQDPSAQDSSHIQHLHGKDKNTCSNISTTDVTCTTWNMGAPSQTKTEIVHGFCQEAIVTSE